jgi:serine/threonine protein kinase
MGRNAVSEKLRPLQAGQEPYPGYRLHQALGEGAFGQVWEAEKAGGVNVALKFMPFASSTAAAKEIRAIQNIRQLHHPGLVQIERVWSQPGYVVICMELAEGSLLDLYQSYQSELGMVLPAAEVCRHLTQVAEALDFLNARQHLLDGQRVGIQHCDVKPSNILLLGDQAKLCDFGLAASTASQVRMHRRQGTPDYAAPEVFLGRLSQHCDQYSLAITYCALRSGTLPFPPINHLRGSWPQRRPSADLSMLSEKEQPIVARALRAVPQDRWPSCCTLMAELRAALGSETRPSNGRFEKPQGERRMSRRYTAHPELLCSVITAAEEPGATAAVEDISLGGIGLVVPDRHSQGEALTLRLESPDGMTHNLRVRVCHCTTVGDAWRIGCTFVHKLQREQIETLIEKNGEDEE